MTKLPISVCMLVLNEGDRLGRSLPPLADFAELVIVDSGSTDNSLELCEQAGATIHQLSWEGFGATRRKLFELAKQPWILWLDADEVVTGELLEELHKLFESPPEKVGYWINRMVCFEGQWVRHGDWFPDWNLRLFRQGSWKMEDRAVHESLQVEGQTGRLQGLLEHHSFRNWEDLYKRSERYARLWAEEHREKKQAGPLAGPSRAFARFLRGYLLKAGLLDGALGYRIARANAREVALKYRLLRELQG